jgi:hypothetical protein
MRKEHEATRVSPTRNTLLLLFQVPSLCVVLHRSAALTIDDGGCSFWVALLYLVQAVTDSASGIDPQDDEQQQGRKSACFLCTSLARPSITIQERQRSNSGFLLSK